MANTEQITARKIGKNLIVMIDNVKYVKVINDVETLESIQNKIKLFNKVNGKSKKQELIDILSPEKVKEKATKSIIKKIEKTIKKKSFSSTRGFDFPTPAERQTPSIKQIFGQACAIITTICWVFPKKIPTEMTYSVLLF